MKNKSCIREKLGEQTYKEISKQYHGIEGLLFQKLDEIIVLANITPDMEVKINKALWGCQSICRIKFFEGFSCEILLYHSQKRLSFKINSNYGRRNHYLSYEESLTLIKKKLNITSSITKCSWPGHYDFKFNSKL